MCNIRGVCAGARHLPSPPPRLKGIRTEGKIPSTENIIKTNKKSFSI
jgi:hypothetical protein